MNFKFKPNSNTDNFVVSNCDLPAMAKYPGYQQAASRTSGTQGNGKEVEPNEEKQTPNEENQMSHNASQMLTRHAKYECKALPVSWDDKEII